MKILVVDDCYAIRTVFSDFLEMEGHAVVSACNSSDALEILSSQAVDLIITDFNMPDGSGVDLLLARPDRAKGLPSILISGAPLEPSDLPPEVSCQTLFKPVSLSVLVAAVNRAAGALCE